MRGKSTIFVRTLAAVICAGLVPLLLATAAVAYVVRADKEAVLVDGAIAEALLQRRALRQRLAVGGAELRAVAIAGATGRLLDVPDIVSEPMIAVRAERDGAVLVDVASDSEASARLEALVRAGADGFLDGEQAAVAHVRVDDVDAYGLIDLSADLRVPDGWTARIVPSAAGASGGVVARRDSVGDRDAVHAQAPIAEGRAVAIRAPVDPARNAAMELTTEVVQWSLLAILPLALLALVLSRAVTSPVRLLARAVRDAAGEPVKMPVLPRDEIGDLGHAIGAMSAQLHEDARILRVAARFARELGRVDDARLVHRKLQRALEECFPAHGWRVVSQAELDDGRVPAGVAATLDWMRGALSAVTAPTAADGDEISSTNASVLTRSEEHCTAIIMAAHGTPFGVAVARAGVAEDGSRMAELLCGTAVNALVQLGLREVAVVNEKLTLLGRMSASVAHEMNNPLAFVTANLRVLEESLEGEPRDMARDAREGADRLARIVSDLSSMAKGGTRQTRLTENLAEIAEVCAKFARAKRSDATVVVRCEEPAYVSCNRGRIEQAVLNLVVNGIDAAAAGGERPRVEITVSRHDGRAIVSVADNGSGVPASVQRRIFDAFYTTKGEHGTGLGLFLSRTFVRGDGGELSLVETGGSGTTFRISLPLTDVRADEPGSADVARAAPRIGVQRRRRVLLLDDEPAIVRAMTRWLRTRVDIVGTTDPEDALERATTEPFELVICDLNMPRMRGDRFIEELESRRPELSGRIVVMTGSDDVSLPVRVLRKPVAPNTLYEILDAL